MAATSSPTAFRVLIIGGGNCGLGIATGLKKAGISYTAFERTSEDDFYNGVRDWGTILHWGTEYFNKLLPRHLQERVRETYVDPNCEYTQPIPYFKADTGEIINRIATPVISRVSRRKVRRFLTQGEDLDIRFDKKCRSVSIQGEAVVVEFDDGTKEMGSVLVGCDGSHSVVRQFLVGEEAGKVEELDHTMINYASSGYTPEQARLMRSWHPINQLAFMHDALPGAALVAILDAPDPDDTTDWKFQCYTSWDGPPYASNLQDPEVRMKFVRERMVQFCDPFRTAFLAADPKAVMPVYAGAQWAPRMKWDNHGGRVTIAGDAAHSMLPHRGQGFNNAIKDASDIVDVIQAAVDGTCPLGEGMTAYEEEMRVRGSEEVDLSFQQMQASVRKDLKDSPMFRMGHGRPGDPSTQQNPMTSTG